MNLFAQATNVPSTGASNAEDFQPLTRNPQTTGGGLQPGTVPQSTTTQDILSSENARITVPVSNGQTVSQPPTALDTGGGINWFLVIVGAAVIVAALEYVFRRREKSRRAKVSDFADASPQEVIEYPTEDEQEEPKEALSVPAGIMEPQKTPNEPKQTRPNLTQTPKKKKPNKSKSKRKKSKK